MSAPAAKDRPVFTVQFRAKPGIDAIKALRALVKRALRNHGLKCVSASEDIIEGNDDA
jgi:hypothetical protein